MNQDSSKGPGSDLKFIFWDDVGDSQVEIAVKRRAYRDQRQTGQS